MSKQKQWKQIAIEIAVGNSNSAAFTLKKNYIRHLLAYECVFDRGGMDPQQILAEIETTTSSKKSKDTSGRHQVQKIGLKDAHSSQMGMQK